MENDPQLLIARFKHDFPNVQPCRTKRLLIQSISPNNGLLNQKSIRTFSTGLWVMTSLTR